MKLNWVYELPFGPGRRFLDVSNPVARKVLEGWSLASVTRLQSGSPILLRSGRSTFNGGDAGVVLHNLTASQLDSMISIRKTSSFDSSGKAQGTVYFLPQAVIDNTLAAFDLVSGKTPDPSQPYIGPATTPGQLGSRIFLYGPPQQKWDLSVVKKTKIGERANIEFRAQALNAFNLTNVFLFTAGNNITTTMTVGSTFGQTAGAYRDLSNTNDPGSRVIEFVMRLNF